MIFCRLVVTFKTNKTGNQHTKEEEESTESTSPGDEMPQYSRTRECNVRHDKETFLGSNRLVSIPKNGSTIETKADGY
jgi:hypothetical protein